MFRWLYIFPHLLIEANAARRDPPSTPARRLGIRRGAHPEIIVQELKLGSHDILNPCL